MAEDFRESCSGTTAYLVSVSLVLVALAISDLQPFLCNIATYIWGGFFLIWLYSLFTVVESVRLHLSSSICASHWTQLAHGLLTLSRSPSVGSWAPMATSPRRLSSPSPSRSVHPDSSYPNNSLL